MTQLQGIQKKTYEILNRYYYWPCIIDDVKRFVKNCYGCKKSKTSKNKYHGPFKPFPVPDKRWAHISIDFIIDFPVNRDLWGRDCINIMVIMYRLSKMVKCILMDGVRDLIKKVRNNGFSLFRRLFANIYDLGRYTRRTTKS